MDDMHQGHRRRLRDRFRNEGLENFDDLHILEILLTYAMPRRDTNQPAHRLLECFGSLANVLEAKEQELCTVEGVGMEAALYLRMFAPIFHRYTVEKNDDPSVLHNLEECANYIRNRFPSYTEEIVMVLCMDGRGKVLDCRPLQRGCFNSVGISPRQIVEHAMTCKASLVVVAHNHTSGVAIPSLEDRVSTRILFRAMDSMGILLADHIIVTEQDYVSLAADGIFEVLLQEKQERLNADRQIEEETVRRLEKKRRALEEEMKKKQ